jgi:ATP-dependent DNA helicase DinG
MSDLRRGDLQPLEPNSVAQFLGASGPLAERIEDHETRPSQQTMAASVATALNQGDALCVEAPTGVGKSLAYVLPAGLWARNNQRRVLVATRTINLQRQLIDKDLPALASMLLAQDPEGEELRYVELVGRGNYLCPQRLEEAFRQPALKAELSEEQHQDLWRLKAWSLKVDHQGRRQDLSDAPDRRVWDEANADADNCAGPKCPHYDRCPFFLSRRRASTADILVVNHALMLADVVLKGGDPKAEGVLPRWDAAVVDEAHHLEAEATRAFTVEISNRQLIRQLDRLMHPRIAGAGDLGKMDLALGGVSGALEDKAHALSNRIVEDLPDWLAAVRQTAERLWAALAMSYGDPQGTRQVWIDEARREGPEWQQTLERLEEMRVTLERLVGRIENLLDDAEHHGLIEAEPFVEQAARGLSSRLARLKSLMQAVRAVSTGDQSVCTWVEVGAVPNRRGARFAAIQAAPIAVAEPLHELFFAPNWATIMTSATLSADRRFDLLLARTGLALARPAAVTLELPSPFDHAAQALLAVVPTMPDPRADNGNLHTDALVTAVDQLTRSVGGGTLVLFTSFRAMNRVYEALAAGMVKAGMTPMIQARRGPSRAQLLERFRSAPAGVLFATDSFWEGIDVPGDALRLVLITRLPFSVPTEPIAMARHDRLRAVGRNPFFELTLPQAILRLRQGYGRLIRRRSDRGAVVILDPRVETARYGRRFLDSLPPARRVRGELGVVAEALRHLLVPQSTGESSD